MRDQIGMRSVRALTDTYHFEVIEFFLDLLCQHRGQAVASSNVATTVILLAVPSVVEDDARAEGGIALERALGRSRCALGVLAEAKSRHEIILAADGNRSGPSVALGLVVGGARGTRSGRIGDLGDVGQVERGS